MSAPRKRKPGRGGARPGSGRPRVGVPVLLDVPREVLDAYEGAAARARAVDPEARPKPTRAGLMRAVLEREAPPA